MVTVRTSIGDLPQALYEALSRVAKMPDDWTPLLRRAALYLGAQGKASFDRQADPQTGAAWAPLGPWAARSKRRGRNAKALIDRGILRTSVTGEPRPPRSVAVFTNVIYGGYHQWGTRYIPARPYLGVSEEAADVANDMAVEFLLGAS